MNWSRALAFLYLVWCVLVLGAFWAANGQGYSIFANSSRSPAVRTFAGQTHK